MEINLSAGEILAAINAPREPHPPTAYELLGEKLFDRIGMEYADSIPVDIERTHWSTIHEWRSDGLMEPYYRIHLGEVRPKDGMASSWFVRDFLDPSPLGKGYNAELEMRLARETLSAPNQVEERQLRQKVIETFGRHFGFKDLQSL